MKTLKFVKGIVSNLAETRRNNAVMLNGIEEKQKAITGLLKRKEFNAKLCDSLM